MLLVIGLDGADWNILNPWIEAGHLPHLAALRARATWGPLRSTIRPESSTAWATFATGVNPARHGIFGFSAQQPGSYETTLNTAAQVRVPSFWMRAAAEQRRVALLNVPMTYPPQPFAGALVAGMLTPSLRSTFTHPPDLGARLLAAVPDYTVNVERTGLGLRPFIRQTTAAIAARGRAGRWLLAQERWDAAVIVFTASDRLQHYTLHLLDSRHPRHDPAEAAALLPDLLAAYQTLDAALADLVAAAGPRATLVVLSDHGFAPCARAFLPNAWLEQEGLLVRRAGSDSGPGLWRRLRRQPVLRRLKSRLPLLRDWRRPPAAGDHLAGIDWARTAAAYSPAGGIRFNIRGREPEGLLSPDAADRLAADLIAALSGLVDAETGATPLLTVYRREALYEGPHLHLAPDLILEPRRADPDPARNTTYDYGFAPHFLAGSGEFTGNHTLDGIFMAAGPGIEPQYMSDAHLIDLAPTLLHALDLPVSLDLEGRVLPLWANGGEVRRVESREETVPSSSSVLSTDDEAALAERLRSLGYL